MQSHRFFTFFATLALSTFAYAQDYSIDSLRIEHPVARPSFPGQSSSAAYFTIENQGKTSDKLIAADSPIVKSVQIHTMTMDGDVMKMREVDGIVLTPGSKTVMQPGNGYHLMLLGLKKPLKIGDTVPLMLTFEKAGKLQLSASVQAIKPAMGMGSKDGHAHMRK